MVSSFALRVFGLSLSLAVAPFALAACGGGREASEMQLAALRAEITKLRAETAALGERLDAVEITQGTFRGANAGSSAKEKAAAPGAPGGGSAGGAAKGSDRPELAVVRLAPDVAPPPPPAGEDPEGDDGPRPVIRSVGGGAVVEDSSSSSSDASGRGGDAARKKKKGWSPAGDASSSKKGETARPKGPSPDGAGSSKMPVP